jgi:hypothetical protein
VREGPTAGAPILVPVPREGLPREKENEPAGVEEAVAIAAELEGVNGENNDDDVVVGKVVGNAVVDGNDDVGTPKDPTPADVVGILVLAGVVVGIENNELVVADVKPKPVERVEGAVVPNNEGVDPDVERVVAPAGVVFVEKKGEL